VNASDTEILFYRGPKKASFDKIRVALSGKLQALRKLIGVL